eukprot:scaffold779_cov92-Cylindrotheca_fusiformis.AAC.2
MSLDAHAFVVCARFAYPPSNPPQEFKTRDHAHQSFKRKPNITTRKTVVEKSMSSSSPYAPAGNILNQIFKTRKGLKSIAYNQNGELTCSKTTYAQCSHVLQYKPLLDSILKRVKLLDVKNQGLLYILLYELLLGPNKKIRGGGALKRQLMSQKDLLLSTLKELQPSLTDESASDHVAQSSSQHVTIPRYVRINTILSSTNEILPKLENAKIPCTYYMDRHVPDVLVLPPTASTRGSLQDLVTSHQVILQDKSSCFSALCLVHGFDTPLPTKGGDVLDACAAPGNKTSHLAALLAKQSNIKNCNVHALDKSKDRFKLLQRRMRELTTTTNDDDNIVKVHCHNMDFLTVSPKDDDKFSNVTAILLDPSCSGSGMISNHPEWKSSINNKNNNNHRDNDDDPTTITFTNDRIKALSNFQFQALQHAITNFPKVERIVYSTCSIYVEENEGVIHRLLESTNDEWELVAPQCLRHWKRRGHFDSSDNGKLLLTKEQSKCLIRVDPLKDASNGFFVACLQRKKRTTKQEQGGGNKKKVTYNNELTLPEGMEFYNNQFHNDKKSTLEEKEKSLKQQKEETKDRSKPNNKRPKDAVADTPPKPSINKKRKAVTTTTTDAILVDDSQISKKRAKKLEWKKKQREKKQKRLQKQQQQNSTSTKQEE